MFEKQQFSFLQFFHSCLINHENEHMVLNKTTKSLDRLLARVYHRSIGKGKKETKLMAKTKVMSEVQLVPLALASNLKALILNNLMYLLLFTKCLCHGTA